MRTIITISDKDAELLSEICRREKISRAEAIRRAITGYTKQFQKIHEGAAETAFGILAGQVPEALEYEDKLRKEWERDEGGH